MSTTTKNVGRVSIVPKGDWNINNTYIRLDLVTYDGNSYIAKKDVPKNIQLSNNNYWMLMASKGRQGEQGEQGAPFAIMKSYASIAAMNADFSNTDVQNGQFVIIDTGNVQDPDNAKLYYKGSSNYVFVTDMSGAAGIQGPRGASAYEQAVAGGYTGTETQFNEDLANFKELSEQAADSAKDAEAYAIGKRGGTDVESTDLTYHNNAKYYSEQAALIVDDIEQVTTATTVGPADIATFNASAAGMPLKGLTVDIEPVQDFNGYSRPWLGGAGKNQLSLSMSFLYEKNTNGTWTNNSYVSNGVTFVVQLNNNNDVIGIEVNGTASANTDFVFIERAPISEYPIIENGCPSGGSDSTYRITTRVYYSDFGVIDYYDYGSGLRLSNSDGHSESFSSQIRIYSGYIASNLVFRPMIRFYYDEDETFEPYSNICPITGWTGCKLHHTGVSLIGGDAFLGNAFTKNDGGYELTYGGSGISQRGSAYADITDLPAGRYTLQFINYTCPDGCTVTFRFRSPGGSWTTLTIIGGSAYGRRSFTMPANAAQIQFYFSPNTASVGDKLTADDVVLMREEDNETPEPYKGNIYNITFPSEAGTVYGGTLDMVNKKLIVTKKYALLNDPDKWSETGVRTFQYSDQFSDRKRYQTILEGFLCSCAGTSVSGPGLKARWIDNTDYFGFFANSPNNDSDILDKIKTAAANNKIAILYDLAEPLVYDITTEQVATLLGENNIWANRGDVTVTYGAYLETIKTYADRSADNAAAAEDAQEAAEAAQEAAEAALANIPSDYTELSDAVNGDVVDIDPGTLTPGYVDTNVGNIRTSSSGLGVTDFIDVHDYVKIAYLRLRSTSTTATTGMCFYDSNQAWVTGIVSLKGQDAAGYDTQLTVIEVPAGAYYARFTAYRDTATYGNFIIKGIKASIPDEIENVNITPQFGNIFTVDYAVPVIDTTNNVLSLYDKLVEDHPKLLSKNILTSDSFTNYEYVFSTGNYNIKGNRSRDSVIEKPKVLIMSGIHGDERAAVVGLYHLVKAMCEHVYTLNTITDFCEFRIIPVVNPYGYDNNSRLNSNGVNINRNFDSPNWTLTQTGADYSGAAPGDQLETQVIQNWLTANQDAAVFIDCHNSGNLTEIACLLGLSDTEHLKAKRQFLYSINKIIPYLKKRRNIQDFNTFSYTGNTDTAGAAKAYGEYKNIMSFTFETSFNVDQHGKNGEFSNALTCEMTGAMLKGLVKYVLLKDPINAAILG